MHLSAGGNRSIGTALYVLSEVQLMLANGGQIVFATVDADDDALALDWDADNVRALIGCLCEKHYYKSEWCQIKNHRWLDCDSYRIRFNDSENIEDLNFPEYFIKFGFLHNSVYCGIVSCHLS